MEKFAIWCSHISNKHILVSFSRWITYNNVIRSLHLQLMAQISLHVHKLCWMSWTKALKLPVIMDLYVFLFSSRRFHIKFLTLTDYELFVVFKCLP